MLSVKDLYANVGDKEILKGLSIEVKPGEVHAIMGPNGSGKTTLLKVVNREIYPVLKEDSSVHILGRSRWNVWELRSHIGVVSHDLQMKYRESISGLDVVLSGYLSSVGIHGYLAGRISAHRQSASMLKLDPRTEKAR